MSVFGTTARPIVFTISGAALTHEAVKAAIAKVQELEDLYVINPTGIADLTAATAVLTGLTPYKIFVFTLTTVMATGTYTFVLEEIAPNVETSTELNP